MLISRLKRFLRKVERDDNTGWASWMPDAGLTDDDPRRAWYFTLDEIDQWRKSDAEVSQLEVERDAAVEALQNVAEFLETVTEWTGTSGEELEEIQDVIEQAFAVLAPAPEAETT